MKFKDYLNLTEMSYTDLKTDADVANYMKIKIKEYGSKNEFLSSEEYKKAYPIILKIPKSSKQKTGVIVFFPDNHYEKSERGKFAFVLRMVGPNMSFLSGGATKFGNLGTMGSMALFDNVKDLEKYIDRFGYTALNTNPISYDNKNEIKKILK